MDNHFNNNKIKIEIAAPIFVIPFKQETVEQVVNSECWVYTMGDLSFKDTVRENIDHGYHECFELKLERFRFEFAASYGKWKDSETVKILSDISASTLIVRKRDINQMRTLEQK